MFQQWRPSGPASCRSKDQLYDADSCKTRICVRISIYIKHCHAGEITNIKNRKRTGDCDFEKKHAGDWKQKHSVLDLLEKTTKKSKF